VIIPVESLPLNQYNDQELITLRARIDESLPTLNEIDLQQELVLQFVGAKALLKDVQSDIETPLNQKAQIINSASAILKQLASIQTELYSAERNKALELTLIELIKAEADPETRDWFLEEYERRLEKLA